MTGGPEPSSSAALATVRVSQSRLESDFLLNLIVHLASPFQVHLSKVEEPPKGGNKDILECHFPHPHHDHHHALTQRNAILRALCGAGLHYALDERPYYLLGGNAMSPTSAYASMARASLTAWMSVADGLHAGGGGGNTEQLLTDLDTHLVTNAFLIPGPVPSLADLDLALAMMENKDTLMTAAATRPAIHRWLQTCQAVLVEYAEQAGLKDKLVAKYGVITTTTPTLQPPPRFFDGTEDVDAVLQSAACCLTQSTNEQTKQQQQQQQQQQGDKKQQQPRKEKKQQQQPKKKQQQQQQQQQAPTEYNISALDLRVGQITKAWHHEKSDKLFCETVDLGNGETREIASGLRQFYKLQDLEGQRVIVVSNLKKMNMVGFGSHGMVLCASNDDHTNVEFVVPPEGAAIGERVMFEGYEGDPEPENKVNKKNILKKLLPDLQTDGQGQVVWKGALAKTSGGIVKAIKGMANAHVS